MNYKKLFGFAILIYIATFVVWGALDMADMGESAIFPIATLSTVIIFAYLFGKKVKANSTKEILKYSIGWFVVLLLLDMVFTVPFTGWTIFSQWLIWVGYASVVFVPILTVRKKRST